MQGGTRVLLQPETKLNQYDLSILIDSMKERLNVYGLSDLVVRDANDLVGNQYIVVEIAGATEDEIKDLLAKQGKFESKNRQCYCFQGRILFMLQEAPTKRALILTQGCSKSGSEWFCRFRFSITLSQDAAQNKR